MTDTEQRTRDELVSEVCRLRAHLRVIRDRTVNAHLEPNPYSALAFCHEEACDGLYGPEVRSARAPPPSLSPEG